MTCTAQKRHRACCPGRQPYDREVRPHRTARSVCVLSSRRRSAHFLERCSRASTTFSLLDCKESMHRRDNKMSGHSTAYEVASAEIGSLQHGRERRTHTPRGQPITRSRGADQQEPFQGAWSASLTVTRQLERCPQTTETRRTSSSSGGPVEGAPPASERSFSATSAARWMASVAKRRRYSAESWVAAALTDERGRRDASRLKQRERVSTCWRREAVKGIGTAGVWLCDELEELLYGGL